MYKDETFIIIVQAWSTELKFSLAWVSILVFISFMTNSMPEAWPIAIRSSMGSAGSSKLLAKVQSIGTDQDSTTIRSA